MKQANAEDIVYSTGVILYWRVRQEQKQFKQDVIIMKKANAEDIVYSTGVILYWRVKVSY